MAPATEKLELWGGVECTIARVRRDYRNQLVDTGHFARPADLDAIHALGIRTLRYPVLWEAVAPDRPDACDWKWSDARLGQLNALGIAVIAGLTHHGSGPSYTSLLDPDYPSLLARHAEQVARRYPWISMYTPVNEPLTTARFSALHGHWYPHGRDEAMFLRALVNQCKAVALAMGAIRAVRSDVRLVQTEDLGKTFSTPRLSVQAEYENDRRWLSLDLLCGRVDRDHPWHGYLLQNGIAEDELAFLCEAACAPDIIGINHYLTSERFLDERLDLYPPCTHGGNGHEHYADVEAVRMDLPAFDLGPKARLAEAWERYRRPLAVTEAHNGCTREEQLRWLMEIWRAAEELRGSGADVRAVTVWSLFGAVDWNSLLTKESGCYETGAFDVRGPHPRRTAVGAAAASLATTGAFDHPVLDTPGWWRRDARYYHPPGATRLPAPKSTEPARRILIAGASGTLGKAFGHVCAARGLECALLFRRQMDIADPTSVDAALERYRPWAVINAAGYVRVDQAGREREECFRANVVGAEVLARACAGAKVPFVTFSSDRVFDGQLGRAYLETDPVSPVCVYGESKARAEERVVEACPHALIVRTSAFFGPWDRYNFIYRALQEMSAGRAVRASGEVVSPTYVPDLAHAVLDLLIDDECGIWHLANAGAISWKDLARRLAERARRSFAFAVDEGNEVASPFRALSTATGVALPSFDDALHRYFAECELDWSEPVTRVAAE